MLLGAHAGLRVSEMTALKWQDVNLSEAVLRVVAGKGGKTARVYLTPTLIQVPERPGMCCLVAHGKQCMNGSSLPVDKPG